MFQFVTMGARWVAELLSRKGNIASALKYLGLEAVEMEYFSDDTVYGVERDEEKVNLTVKEDRKLLCAQLDRHQIKISALLMHNGFGDPDRQKQIDWVLRCMDTAEYFGVDVIRIDPVIRTGEEVSVEKAAEMSSEVLKKVFNQIPSQKRIYLAIENHGRYGNDPEFLRRVKREVNDDRLGLTLDSGNFYWYGFPLDEVYEIFKEFAPLTRHTHIKNIKYPHQIRNVNREMGYRYSDYVSPIYEGDIDHARLVKILNEAGYKGDLCMEDESWGKFSGEEILEVAKKDVEYLKRLVR